ncbi:MAG: hypothetical protein LBL63_04325 [Clostridiales Family XIII bacterium]|jgi:hypothetical protein|nr:hypothetical protein [Clostridiales Family XIII bacterium]
MDKGSIRRRAAFAARGVRDGRGSLGVETAIFLPLFILGLLTVGYLIKIASVEEKVFHATADETRLLAAQAAAPALSVTYARDLTERLNEEAGDDIGDVTVGPVRYRMPGYGLKSGRVYTDLIAVSVGYTINLKLPAVFKRSADAGNTVLCRAFVGRDDAAAVMPFDEMERDGDGRTVWIFPRAGTRYHGPDCSYIKNEPKELLLSASVRARYKPCELCKPNGVGDGNFVYCFSAAGEAYHLGNCFLVERYVIETGEEDAKERGYSACSKCGGI